jgi:hypothetical protein
MTADTIDGNYPRLSFVVDDGLIAGFFRLLQQGVKIRCRTGCSVDIFLREELGAVPETINKIQSIILDGKPVDDIGAALVHDGSVLALSAAMPGLVGATLRRGGAYSSFRGAITYRETEPACMPSQGWVCIKIFNLLMAEMGPGLLRQGVLVKTVDLTEMLAEWGVELQQGCSVTLDDRSIGIGAIGGGAIPAGADRIFLTVNRRPVSV